MTKYTPRVLIEKRIFLPMESARQKLRNSHLLPIFLKIVSPLIVLSLCWLIYQFGTQGPLLLDGLGNLVRLGEGALSSFDDFLTYVFGNRSGPTGRPVSMLSFLIDGDSWPIDVESFKKTNVLIHLLCGVSVAGLAFLVFKNTGMSKSRAYTLSLFSMAIWLFHPLNVSTVLYVIQRMTQLATLFALLSLSCFMLGRTLILTEVRKGLIFLCLSLFPFGLLSVLSKENGALIILAIVILEFTIFAGVQRNRVYRWWFGVCVLIPLGIICLYLIFGFDGYLERYHYRSFSMGERLITETRVVTGYLSSIFYPQIADFTLYQDGMRVSSSLWSPITGFLSLIFIVTLLGLATKERKSNPILAFAIFWFFAWHILESTFIPLELYFEHRNYLPMLGPIVGVCYYVSKLFDNVRSTKAQKLIQGCSCVALILLAYLTLQLSYLWGNTGQLVSYWAVSNAESKRAQTDFSKLYASIGEPEKGMERLVSVVPHYPSEISLYLQIWNYACWQRLESPYTLGDIANSKKLDHFYDSVVKDAVELIENVTQRRCGSPPESEVLALMARIDAIELSPSKTSAFNYLHSIVLDMYGYYDEALVKLDQAFEFEQDITIVLLQLQLTIFRGRVDDAAKFAAIAYDLDAARSWLKPSKKAEIDKFVDELRVLRLESEMVQSN